MTDRLVRLEWNADGTFEDRATLAAIDRSSHVGSVEVEAGDEEIVLRTACMTVRYRPNGKKFSRKNLSIEFGEHKCMWKPGARPKGNLGGTVRTLDGVNGRMMRRKRRNPCYKKGAKGKKGREWFIDFVPLDLGEGLLSRDGWTLFDDSDGVVLDETGWVQARPKGKRQDWYFLVCDGDYVRALQDAALVFGRQPVPPRYALGYWWSRYWAYTDEEFIDLVDQFDRSGVPIDVMVVDMDWHLEGWTGYTWDPRYFPDPDAFLRHMRERGLRVTLNLHPADGMKPHEQQFEAFASAVGDPAAKEVHFDCADPAYMRAYFDLLHRPEERRGVDFWWIDWQQGSETSVRGLDPLPWLNHLHWRDMEQNPDRGDQRPLIFSRYGGLGAGRYCIGFSGDTYSNWESLAFQPEFTATAANVLYGYWSHDIGGHQPGPIDGELYTRWMQFGVYSPILRTHTSKHPDAERRFWAFPSPYSDLMAGCVKLRYELVPYIYAECLKAWDTGVSLCRPMYYHWPDEEDAYLCPEQYMFGDHMLVRPVTSPVHGDSELAEVDVWLPPGEWIDTARGLHIQGGQMVRASYLIDEVPVFVRPGTVIPGQRDVMRLGDASIHDLVVTAYAGGSGSYTLVEDDGLTMGYQRGERAETPLAYRQDGDAHVVSLGACTGGYAGFAPEKSLEVRLVGVGPATSVRIGDYDVEQVTYDAARATVIARLPHVDLRNSMEVRIVCVQSSVVSGLPGLFRRLQRVSHYSRLATSYWILHPEERLGTQVAQAGRRIQLNPATFVQETDALSDQLKRLRKVLKDMEKKHRGGDEDRAAYCVKARRLLKAARAMLQNGVTTP